MIGNIIWNNLIIREWLNGGLLPLNVCLTAVIGLFLWDTWRAHRSGWSKQDGVDTACVLFWIFTADGIRAGCVWYLLWAQNRGTSTAWIEPTLNWGFAVAAVVALAATFRCIYLFTPPAWGHRGWIGCGLITAAFLAVTHAV